MHRVLERAVRRLFRPLGLDVSRVPSPRPTLLRELLDLYGVEAVFDVGANTGQSGEHLRAIGYGGTIVSFEPIESLFNTLRAKALPDHKWLVERAALGEREGEVSINVSGGHAGASSLLPMTSNVLVHAPDQSVVGQEIVPLKTLDSVADAYYPAGDRLFLKLDVQGYEKNVLEGGARCLPRVVGMKVEMSLVENYVGETLLIHLLPFIYERGFRLVQFEHGWGNPITREVYQVDGLFFRTDKLAQR